MSTRDFPGAELISSNPPSAPPRSLIERGAMIFIGSGKPRPLSSTTKLKPARVLLQDSLKASRIREIVNANYHLVGNASGIGVFDRNP